MKLGRAILTASIQFVVYVLVPLFLISAINSSYPGLLDERYINLIHFAAIIGVSIVILYILSGMTRGWLSVIFELAALALVLYYAFTIMGQGQTQINYEDATIRLYYPILMYIILFSIALRFPAVIFKYLAEKEEKPEFYEQYEQQ